MYLNGAMRKNKEKIIKRCACKRKYTEMQWKNMKYVGDNSKWRMPEKWQTAHETVKEMTGDCEDGAILMYVLARLKGISANRLMLMAGNVIAFTGADQVGHCWLQYKPTRYPLNWVIIDWCYMPELIPIENQNKYLILGKTIITEQEIY